MNTKLIEYVLNTYETRLFAYTITVPRDTAVVALHTSGSTPDKTLLNIVTQQPVENNGWDNIEFQLFSLGQPIDPSWIYLGRIDKPTYNYLFYRRY